MVMALRNSTFLIQDNKTLKEMEEDLGGILTMVKKHFLQMEDSEKLVELTVD